MLLPSKARGTPVQLYNKGALMGNEYWQDDVTLLYLLASRSDFVTPKKIKIFLFLFFFRILLLEAMRVEL